MPKGEVPSRSEQEADECLHCAIIDMVDERIADVPPIAGQRPRT